MSKKPETVAVRYVGISTLPVFPVFGDVEYEVVPGEVVELPYDLVHGTPADKTSTGTSGLLAQGRDADGNVCEPCWELVTKS